MDIHRAKSAFFAHMRHELRTPINAIIGYSELLIEDAEEKGHQAFVADLQKVNSAGRQLLGLVNSILDPSKIETRTDIDLEKFQAEMRHALRIPLSSIIGYADILIEDSGKAHQDYLVPDLKKIRASGERLLSLINDILSLWQVQAGNLELDLKASDTFTMIQDTVSFIPTLAEKSVHASGNEGGFLLVVDDNETNRDLLSRSLERYGHKVCAAENGRRALELVRAENFDLVLLDILMPEMNGYQVLMQLKANEALRHIPVIMLSALDEIDSVVRCIELGADDYLPKPFNTVLLRARINACMEKKRLRDREQAYLEQLRIEREKSERLLSNILPQPIADRLKQGERPIADGFADVTVLFADLVGFTEFAASVSAVELVDLLNTIFSAFDRLAEIHGLEKIKTIGDAYMAVAGLPTPRPDHVKAVADMALDMLGEIASFRIETGKPFRLRIGMNTGPVVAGVIGTKKFIYDLWGDTVNTASRMESHSHPDCIHVTECVYQRLRDEYLFEEQGVISIKGKGEMKTYLLKARKV